MKKSKLSLLLVLCLCLQGCLGTIVGQTVDVAIEVVKVPFKVGAAVIDVIDGDDDKKEKKSKKTDSDE